MKTTPDAEEAITINILIPHYRLRVISVSRSATIGSLKKSLNDFELIFNGELLNDSHTIEFCGIQPNDSIVAIPTEPEEVETVRWMKITRDSDVFEEAVRSLASRTSRPESFRLQDLRTFKLESRPRSFRKLCQEWRNSECLAKVERTATQIPSESPAISEEPLPICW
jgi:hypothetical protein